MEALIGDLTARRARLDGSSVALICDDRRVDFAALEALACRAANALIGLGINPGDRVALLMRNGIDYVALYYATAKIGAILCPLNWRLAPPEIGTILAHSEAHLLLYDSEFASTIDALPELSGVRERFALDSFVSRIAETASDSPDVAVDADDPLLLVYTSGTTGRAKGVALSHRQMLWTSMTMAATLDYRRCDVDLIAAPLFHVGGLSFATHSIHVGAASVLQPTWNAGDALDLIARERINHFFAVAAMVEALVAQPGFASTELESLRWIMAGGAPVPTVLIETLASHGIPLIQSYGSTETGGPATVVDIDNALGKAGSAGLPFFHTEVQIADDAGAPLPAETVGEVQVRGPHLATYWRDPAATRAAFVDGWFRMGDLGYLDSDGYLYILGRQNDLIVSGGENIYPAEVEAVLADLSGVEEVAVVGVADERWGEVACAVVVTQGDRALTLDEIAAHCDGRIARYKTPRRLIVRAEPLPRNATGKIRRAALKDDAAN